MVKKRIVIEKANRLYQLPPELKSFLPEKRRRSLIRKIDVIDLATFRWPIVSEEPRPLSAADLAPADADAVARLQEALAAWYLARLGVRLNPEKEIFIGGSTTAVIFALTLAFVDYGDAVFVPELGLPLYRRAVVAAGGEPVPYDLNGKTGWLPDFRRLGARLGRAARFLFLNSPHNPTGAELDEKQLTDLSVLAARANIVVVNDIAYSTLAARRPPSLLGTSAGKRNGVEVGNLSYLFGSPYLPISFVAGSRDIISGLQQAARLVAMSAPAYAVDEAASIVRDPSESLNRLRAIVAASRAEAVKLLDLLDLEPVGADTVPFVWARIERRRTAAFVAAQLYRRTRILALPGTAFGNTGEGFLRFSLTAPAEAYVRACDQVRRSPRLPKFRREQ